MAYFLRTTKADGTSYGGFQWPREVGAVAEAPDWDAKPACGGGLHGLRDGLGGSLLLDWSPDALWWIVEADDADCVDLDGKWKFPRCNVVAFGQRYEITTRLHDLRPGPIHGLVLTKGDGFTLIGGDWSTLTGDDRSTMTGGYGSKLIFLRWIGGRRRALVAYVGEGGIKPGVAYRANDDHTAVVEAA